MRRVLTLLFAGVAFAQHDDGAFRRDVAPVLKASCVACHSGREPKGELDLSPVVARSAAAADDLWRRVRDRVAACEMPPPGQPAPTGPERARFTAWIDRRLRAESRPSRPLDPGRPVVRRLSRTEYANAVRDLLGVAVRVDEELPPDDLGYGFDNAADASTLSPAALEKYLAVAARVADEAVLDEDPAHPPVRRFVASEMDCDLKPSTRNGFRVLYSSGSVTARVDLPRDGRYVLRARAYGDQAGPEPARLAFVGGGRTLATADVKETADAPRTCEAAIELKRGTQLVGAAFVNDFYEPKNADPAKRDRNLAIEWFECAGPIDAREPPAAHRALFAGDDPSRAPKERAAKLLGPLLLRLWRRPPAIDEVDRLSNLAADVVKRGGRFAGGMKLALSAALASPHFVFRVERDAPGSPAVRDLNGYEAATRLAFFLWSSAPDDRLLARAAKERAWSEATFLDEAARMLDDARATALAENFAVQWWELRNLDAASPDPGRFPAFDEPLRAAMRREAELFFDAVLREGRAARTLIDADFTFVNGPLARHYGLAAPTGTEFRRVKLDDARRGGVTGFAGVHVVTSNPTRSSPVKRGKWLLDNLLDAPPPAPPPGVGALQEGTTPLAAATLREKMELHRKDASCASCHARMDALGFALENYDPTGAWRDEDGGVRVDASGSLPDGRRVHGPSDLRALLRADGAFLRALSKKLLVYAVGRGLGPDDAAAIDAMISSLPADPPLRDVVLGVVRLEAFRKRRVAP
jgi:hypothetical protein